LRDVRFWLEPRVTLRRILVRSVGLPVMSAVPGNRVLTSKLGLSC
jgi:hypothetical protein